MNTSLITDHSKLLAKLHSTLPNLLALYLFASQARGDAHTASDVDLAVLLAGSADASILWNVAQELAMMLNKDVDLIDLRQASTVMQYQIINDGHCLWAVDSQAKLYESFILSEKTALDTARAALLVDTTHTVYDGWAATIERCVARAREEYDKDPASFSTNFTRQDAAVLNIKRACEAALDMGQHLIRRERLGVPQSARDVFELLAQAHWIDQNLADSLKKMVGFRNIAVHDYQTLQLPITVMIITQHLGEFTQYSQALLLKDAQN
ncbi:HepT-like ribonuclease domain-containing protein [Iodobacter arcticus]|uniref:HepT-like ribonuclease domain-containing protein n=1 Tax=Iodobacter arcticus TaxID=590593 RepID=A0ABW2R3N0_9NEIS